jgi:hypothetical protein
MKTVKQMKEEAVAEFKSSMNSAAIAEIVNLRRQVINREEDVKRQQQRFERSMVRNQELVVKAHNKQKAHEEELEKQRNEFDIRLDHFDKINVKLKKVIRIRVITIESLINSNKQLLDSVHYLAEEY